MDGIKNLETDSHIYDHLVFLFCLSKLVQEKKNQIFICKEGKLDMTHITSKNYLNHGLYIQI